MSQVLIVVLAVASFVLTVDLLTTKLRKRVRSRSIASEPPAPDRESGEEPKEGVAIEQE